MLVPSISLMVMKASHMMAFQMCPIISSLMTSPCIQTRRLDTIK